MFVADKTQGEPILPPHIAAILEHADFMDRLVAPDFCMAQFHHSCGTPSCALGWKARRDGYSDDCSMEDLAESAIEFGVKDVWEMYNHEGVYGALFEGSLSKFIRTPQQWAAHARAWCAQWCVENGYAVPETLTIGV